MPARICRTSRRKPFATATTGSSTGRRPSSPTASTATSSSSSLAPISRRSPLKGTSLFIVDADAPGFEKGRKLKKLGMDAQDTAELSFSDVRVPAEALLGELNQGFIHLMVNLPTERLLIGSGSL